MLSREWSKHLTNPKAKQEFIAYVLNSGSLLDRLEELMENWIEELRRQEVNEDYSSPSWSHLQADRLGQLKSLAKIKRLLSRKGTVDTNE